MIYAAAAPVLAPVEAIAAALIPPGSDPITAIARVAAPAVGLVWAAFFVVLVVRKSKS